MTEQEFQKACEQLRRLSTNKQVGWGGLGKQNNQKDKLFNVFDFNDFDDFDKYLKSDESTKRIKEFYKINPYYKNKMQEFYFIYKIIGYYYQRWFSICVSDCQAYLFCLNNGIILNPNRIDQGWDIEFIYYNLKIDIKSSRLPINFMPEITDYFEKVTALVTYPQSLIDFFYDKQSNGKRMAFQNRLFIVFCPKYGISVNQLKADFYIQKQAIDTYANYINKNNPNLFIYRFKANNENFDKLKNETIYSDIIYIFQDRANSFWYRFASEQKNYRII